MLSSAFIDASCEKCGLHIGWFGTMSNRPACRRCGHRPPQDELDEAAKSLQTMMDEVAAESEREDQAEWVARTKEQESWYIEGQVAASAFDDPSSVPPLDRPSPYVATKTPDGEFWKEQHHWWLFGWHDYCSGTVRTEESPDERVIGPPDSQGVSRCLTQRR
ncbi:MAG: hypothetical protein DWQ20_00920 [Actinobacteria bacterium]|nr:MAG: hypothetical protein DWQ20_00920 [Actinomycetota bacterium]